MRTRRSFGKQMLMAGGAALAATHFASAQKDPGTVSLAGSGSLKAHAATRGLLTGTAVNVGLLDRDAAYKRTIIEQYNIVVAENAMKWAPMRPAPDKFFFDEADKFMAFAEANGMAIRGHNLCWHEQLPAWFAGTVTSANAEEYLVKHIQTVVGRYKGRIRAWDVVNEAIDPKDNQPDGFRNGPWYKLLGPRFIEIAFRTARAADPHALLTYNDYDIESDGPGDTAKRAAVMGMIEEMKKRGIPIDALGVQSHISAASAAKIGGGLTAMVNRAQALGLKVFVTELDVNDDGIEAEDPVERAKAVGAIYGSYLGSLLGNAAVADVLTWGVADRYSWLNAPGKNGIKFRPKHPDRKQVCLPFDDSYQPHPAFFALRGAIDARKV